MQIAKVLVPAVAAAALIIGGAAQAAPVKNPSGGVIGQAPNHPTPGTYTYINGAPMNVKTHPVKNPSGGVIGQTPNYPTGMIAVSLVGPSPKPVKNPSGGVIGQPPNHPSKP